MPSMAVAKITLSLVKGLPPGSLVWDSVVQGFGVRRQLQAVKYVLKARIRGRDHWFTIGTHGAPWTPDSARREAQRLLGEIAAGKDLAHVRDRRKSTPTFEVVAEQFLREHCEKLGSRTADEYERLLRKVAASGLSMQ